MDVNTWSVSDILNGFIMALLSLDTIRALIAMTGWVKPDAKYAWIIYGRYERNLIVTGLKEMGFQQQKSDEILKNLREVPEEERMTYGVTSENAAERLIILIAKYIDHFENPIQYGGRRATQSSYYINTMEMAHDEEDRKLMENIMIHLYTMFAKQDTENGSSEKPEVIVTPKGGNPLFAMNVAGYYGAYFIIAKSKSDKSGIKTVENDADIDFKINYEGSGKVLDSAGEKKSIVVDCNTSGGSQLIDIVNDMKRIASEGKHANITAPAAAYVLFRADSTESSGVDIDRKFQDNHCKLYRYFDLDEELKEQIYDLKQYAKEDDRLPDLYYTEDKKRVADIIRRMKEKNLFFYNLPGNTDKDSSSGQM